MIGYFPDLYPDELLYSACARFQERGQFPNKKSMLCQLFGTINSTSTIDLPCHLSNLIANLPLGHSYTVEKLIDAHTLLPFFSPFLPCERTSQLREGMKGSGGLTIHKCSGIMASRISTPTWLRFCPRCKDEDRKEFGETYWHRIHQLHGVKVCHLHNVFLERSDARQDSGRNPLLFTPAENAVRLYPIRNLASKNLSHQIMLKIALDAAWILENPRLGMDLHTLYNRYISLLVERGLASYTGSIHVPKLLEEFKSHYSPSLLRLLRCEFTGSDQIKTNWLLRLVRPSKHTQHPLYHLLLIQFLGCTAEDFFRLPTELTPFGEGPWPCLNPAAEHFREPVIPEFRLSPRLRDNHLTATFSCGCGFAYARSGPDSSSEDRFRIGRMISFGQVWERKLERLWKYTSLSLSEVGRRLGVDPLTVRRHATRLKLPFYRRGRKFMPLKRETLLKGERALEALQEKRHTYRSRWLSAAERNPKVTLKKLRHSLPKEYAWLSQNDSEWLRSHRPQLQESARTKSCVDWKRRDSQYAAAVKTSAARLQNAPGRPVQVTKTAIGRALGAVTLLQQKLFKMPLTAQALASVVETREQYAIRRVWWAADLFLEDGLLPRPWQLISRANVYRLIGKTEIKTVIEAAIQKLISDLWFGNEKRAAS